MDERARAGEERRREDEVLREERAVADEELLKDRERRRRLLAALLAVERSRTDEHLLIERTRMDEMIASRDDFLAIVSRDIRNLLGGIAMSASALERIEGDATVRDSIGREATRIRSHAAQMTRLVGDFSTSSASKQAVSPSRFYFTLPTASPTNPGNVNPRQ